MTHAALIQRLGGCSSLAYELGVSPVTVWRWQATGIPARRWGAVLELCRAQGVPMSAARLFRTSPTYTPEPAEAT